MNKRVVAIAIGLILASAGAAWAVQGDPVPGADVSAEESPGGIVVASGRTDKAGLLATKPLKSGTYLISVSGDVAAAACKRADAEVAASGGGGGATLRKGRGIVVGRAGGAYRTAGATGPGVAVTVSAPGGEVAAEWLNCEALLNPPEPPAGAKPKPARASLSPITLPRGQAAQVLTIAVIYVKGPAS